MTKMSVMEEFHNEVANLKTYREMIEYALEFLYKNLRVAPDEVREIIGELEDKMEKEGDLTSLGRCLYIKAWTYIDKGEYLSGINELTKSYAISQKSNNIEGMIRALNTFGLCYTYIGNLTRAFENFNEALKIASDNNKQNLLSLIMATISESLLEIKQYEDALEYSKKAIDIGGDPANKAVNLARVGYIYHLLGDNENGLEYLTEALAVAEEQMLTTMIPEFLFNIGSVYRGLGDTNRAEESLQLAVKKARTAELPHIEAKASLILGAISLEQSRDDEALIYFQTARKIAQSINSASVEVDSLQQIAQIYKDREQWKEAYTCQYEYHVKSKELFGKETTKQVDSIKMSMATNEAEYYQKMYEQISTISQIGRDIASSLDLEKIVRITYDRIKEILDVHVFGLGFYDEEEQEISYRFFIEEGQWVEPFTVSIGSSDSFGAWCIKNEKEVLINDVESEYKRYIKAISSTDPADEKKFNSLIYIPLVVSDKKIGILSVQSHNKNAYADYQIEMIKALGSYISIAVENGQLYEEVQSLANRDYLTGLMNRAYFNTLAEREILKYKRYDKGFCLIMFDLDNFKSINDEYGHDAGDTVLKEVTQFCNTKIREVDLFARYGGEEFLVLLPTTDLDGGLMLAERLRDGIRTLNIVVNEKNNIGVTASFGLTLVNTEDKSIENVFKRADDAMYKAKKAGKDRVETYL